MVLAVSSKLAKSSSGSRHNMIMRMMGAAARVWFNNSWVLAGAVLERFKESLDGCCCGGHPAQGNSAHCSVFYLNFLLVCGHPSPL